MAINNGGAHILGRPRPGAGDEFISFPHLNEGKPITLRHFLDGAMGSVVRAKGEGEIPDQARAVAAWMFFYGAGSFLKVMDKLNGCIASRKLETAQAELVMESLRREIASVLTRPPMGDAAPHPDPLPASPSAGQPGALPPGSLGGLMGIKIAEHSALDGTKVMILTRSMWIVPSDAMPLIAGAAKDGVLSPEDIQTALVGYKLIDLTKIK